MVQRILAFLAYTIWVHKTVPAQKQPTSCYRVEGPNTSYCVFSALGKTDEDQNFPATLKRVLVLSKGTVISHFATRRETGRQHKLKANVYPAELSLEEM